MAEIDEEFQLATKYVNLIIGKMAQGKKLNTYEYLILLIYLKMMLTDKGLTELKGYNTSRGFEGTDIRFAEIREYVDNRFQETNRKFESLESEIKELRKEMSEIKAKHASIEARLDNIEKEIKDLMKQTLALIK